MAGSPTKPGNWGAWATIHGSGIYEIEYDQSQVSKTQENENSIKRIPCIYAKISGSSWRVCTCRDSEQFQKYCKSKCSCFKENVSETIINSEPKKNYGHGDWDAFAVPKLQFKRKNTKKKKSTKASAKNSQQSKVHSFPSATPQGANLYHGFLGATVIHKNWGTGRIIGVQQNSFLIDFEHSKLSFDFSELFSQQFTIRK